MENVRKIIRKQLFKLLENYPAGAENSSSAPWNQKEPKITSAQNSDDNTYIPLFFNNEITILKNTTDKSKWVFYNGSVKKEEYMSYSDVEDNSTFSGNDEDGQPTFDENYNWELDGQTIANYVNDNINNIQTGEGVNSYEDGVPLVKIDQNLAIILVDTYKDESLKNILFLP